MLADKEGNTIHLGERDCSIQRRHQKLIEESPAPLVDDELREKIGKIAVDAAKAVGYHSAGTIEGLLQDGEYFFLEMNTRVQVEHCVTEEVSGIDIVREQILIAAGEPLSFTQDEVVLRGHAIECRINAEDAAKNFAPAPGTVDPLPRADRPRRARRLRRAERLGDHAALRPDGREADRPRHRPRGRHRADAARAAEFEIEGVTTLIPFHKAIMASEQWAKGETCRDLIGDRKWLKELAQPKPEKRADDEPEPVERTYTVEVSGKRFDVTVHGEPMLAPANGAAPAQARKPARAERAKSGGGRRRRADLAAPGQHVEGAGGEGRDGRGGPAHLHHRGDEDGERDHRPQGGHDRGPPDHRGRRRQERRPARRHQVIRVAAPDDAAVVARCWAIPRPRGSPLAAEATLARASSA